MNSHLFRSSLVVNFGAMKMKDFFRGMASGFFLLMLMIVLVNSSSLVGNPPGPAPAKECGTAEGGGCDTSPGAGQGCQDVMCTGVLSAKNFWGQWYCPNGVCDNNRQCCTDCSCKPPARPTITSFCVCKL